MSPSARPDVGLAVFVSEIDAGALTKEEADAAPWRHTRLLRGAVFATPNWVYKSTRKVNAESADLFAARYGAWVDRLRPPAETAPATEPRARRAVVPRWHDKS